MVPHVLLLLVVLSAVGALLSWILVWIGFTVLFMLLKVFQLLDLLATMLTRLVLIFG